MLMDFSAPESTTRDIIAKIDLVTFKPTSSENQKEKRKSSRQQVVAKRGLDETEKWKQLTKPVPAITHIDQFVHDKC
jgi:hypothetical protein